MTTAVRVRSAADLIRGLESSDVALHLAMLGAVVRDPARALRYGRDGDRDVLDVLLELLARTRTPEHAETLFGAICRCDDPRVLSECRRRLAMPGPPALRRRAAMTLAERDPAGAMRFLGPWLHQDRDPATAAIAAQALAGLAEATDEDRIRIAAATEAALERVPRFDATTAPRWLAELVGPFGDGARLRLMEQGEPAYEALAARWEELAPAERRWLLEWGTRSHPMEAVVLLKRALTEEPGELKLLALELLPGLGAAAAWFGPLLAQFTEASEPLMLRAAIRAGRRGLDWRRLIRQCTDRRVRLMAIGCLAEAEGAAALPLLLPLLSDPDWRVRAAATRALETLGAPAVAAARDLLGDPREGVREAVARLLSVAG